MTDEDGQSRLDKLARRDTTSENYIFYISVAIAAVMLLSFLTMWLLSL
jgi:hypothetical protein